MSIPEVQGKGGMPASVVCCDQALDGSLALPAKGE